MINILEDLATYCVEEDENTENLEVGLGILHHEGTT